MIVVRFFILSLVAVFLFSLAVKTVPAASRTERLAMPVSEACYLVRQWLERSGMEVEQTTHVAGQVRMSGGAVDQGGPKWRMDFSPYSSLGTEIVIVAEGDDTIEERFRQLLAYLREREHYPGIAADHKAQVIPEEVLGQIANVACIHVRTSEQSMQFSGFFIDQEGLVLSTAHDLREHEQVQIMTNTGLFYQGDIVKADFDKDLALIKVAATKEEIVHLTSGRNLLGMGETVFSIGCPINLRGTIEKGFVNGPPRKINQVPLWQVHMKIQPGSSGSPVFDSSGAFVAVVKGRHRETPEIGFLIPLEVVVGFLKDYFEQ